ncbi:MAG: hypothetical protein GEV03_22010 [Streptosporangiales bacterium]|nr:hypothetical protein [Streptosporangiales bacterium]
MGLGRRTHPAEGGGGRLPRLGPGRGPRHRRDGGHAVDLRNARRDHRAACPLGGTTRPARGRRTGAPDGGCCRHRRSGHRDGQRSGPALCARSHRNTPGGHDPTGAEVTDAPSVRVDREGRDRATAVVRLCRPRVKNCLAPRDWMLLADTLGEIAVDPGVRACVVTGEGSAFSSGFDLRAASSVASGAALTAVHAAVRGLHGQPVPTVAAVEGPAIGAGWSLALACDVIVAGAEAFFAAPYVGRGLVPDAGLAWFLTQTIGRHRAQMLAFFEHRLSASDAERVGLVSRVVPTGGALTDAIAMADELARLPSLTARVSRGLLRHGATSTLDQVLDREWEAVALSGTDREAADARDRFFTQRERRPWT